MPQENINRGPLLVNLATFETIQKRLTIRGTNHVGKAFEYEAYRVDGDYALVPRYILGGGVLTEARWGRKSRQIPLPAPAVPLWPEQIEGVSAATKVLEDDFGVFLNAQPGSGKTVAALHIVNRLSPAKVLIMVDQDNLAEQWTERIKQLYPREIVTFIMPLDSQRALHKKFGQTQMLTAMRRHDTRGRFIICMTQTLVARPATIDVDVLIVDECHVFSAPTFCQAIFNLSFTWSIGLSANTTRADKLEWIFRAMLGERIVTMQGKRNQARAMFYPVSTGYLNWEEPYPSDKNNHFRILYCKWHKKMTSRFECTSCPTAVKMGTSDPAVLSRTIGCVSFWRNDEFNENSLERHLDTSPKYMAWVLDTIDVLLKDNRNMMVFARLREPLERLHEVLKMDMGDVSGLYMGTVTTAAERQRNAAALKKPVTLCTYKKAGKGLDVAEKNAIVFASPVSKGQLNQVIGRVERALAGKRQPVAIHAVIPFVTSVARMRGCVRWYLDHGYETNIHPTLARHTSVLGR